MVPPVASYRHGPEGGFGARPAWPLEGVLITPSVPRDSSAPGALPASLREDDFPANGTTHPGGRATAITEGSSASDAHRACAAAARRPPRPLRLVRARAARGDVDRAPGRPRSRHAHARDLPRLLREPARACARQLARRDVLVEPEHVVRVVAALQLPQAGEAGVAVRGPHAVRALVAEEVDVDAAG